MLKKTITYTTPDGESITDDFYFNLSKAELVEMQVSKEGGLKEHLERIVASNDGKELIAEMKNLVLGAYGVRSEDGKRFIKNQQLRDEFESSDAYSEFFMELVTNAESAAAFTNGILPQGLVEEAKKIAESTPNPAPEPQKLTQAEMLEMDSDELKSGLATGKYVIKTDNP